jgi:hypothetical protein
VKTFPSIGNDNFNFPPGHVYRGGLIRKLVCRYAKFLGCWAQASLKISLISVDWAPP